MPSLSLTTGVSVSAAAPSHPHNNYGPTAYLTRTESISCAHRLHSPHLSPQENSEVYGRCNNPNGHGHNYRIVVTLKGPVDLRTGMVLNISELRQAMGRVLSLLDHKHLDMDVAWFRGGPIGFELVEVVGKGANHGTNDNGNRGNDPPNWTPRPSTTEMLSIFIWESIKYELAREVEVFKEGIVRLHEVLIEETDKNSVVYRGEGSEIAV